VITEFTAGLSPNSFPIGMAAGPDDNVWFTEAFDPGRVGKIGVGCLPQPAPVPVPVGAAPRFTG
jgi:hypothetical protein